MSTVSGLAPSRYFSFERFSSHCSAIFECFTRYEAMYRENMQNLVRCAVLHLSYSNLDLLIHLRFRLHHGTKEQSNTNIDMVND